MSAFRQRCRPARWRALLNNRWPAPDGPARAARPLCVLCDRVIPRAKGRVRWAGAMGRAMRCGRDARCVSVDEMWPVQAQLPTTFDSAVRVACELVDDQPSTNPEANAISIELGPDELTLLGCRLPDRSDDRIFHARHDSARGHERLVTLRSWHGGQTGECSSRRRRATRRHARGATS
jgi:hypothetical protein